MGDSPKVCNNVKLFKNVLFHKKFHLCAVLDPTTWVQMLPWAGVGAGVGATLAVIGRIGVALWRRRPGRTLTAADTSLLAARKQAEADAAAEVALLMEAAEARAEEQRLERDERAAALASQKEEEAALKRAAEESRRQRAATAQREQQVAREERERLQREQAATLTNDSGDLGDVELGDMGARYNAAQVTPTNSPNRSATGEEVSEEEEGWGGGIYY